MTEKRKGYISWDNYFMQIAQLSAQRSKDPETIVGACIVNKRNQIIGTGYNGFPRGCNDDNFPWGKENSFLGSKYTYVVHAEANAIINSINLQQLQGATIYCSLFPCNECAKLIIQSGIEEVIYYSPKHFHDDYCRASRIMFDAAGVTYRRLELN